MTKRSKPDPYLIDDENPELTDEQARQLRPAADVFRELGIPVPRRRDAEERPARPAPSEDGDE